MSPEDFTQQSILCKGLSGIADEVHKEKELQNVEAAIHSLLSGPVQLVPPSASLAVLLVLCSVGERRLHFTHPVSEPSACDKGLIGSLLQLFYDYRY